VNITRLIGQIGPPVDNDVYQVEFELAEQLETMEICPEEGKLMKVGKLLEVLTYYQHPPIDPDLIDFIESLLVIDPKERPTALEALQLPYLTPSEVMGS
jgi:serine/threonine protein kinase